MFWVHGGSFTSGSGDAWWFGPNLLVNEDIVVITFNYRLGILGHLATGDSASQGNYAMKDMVEALKWTRKNAHVFGGNPEQITIFGESSGGASVNYLVISPMSAGVKNIPDVLTCIY